MVGRYEIVRQVGRGGMAVVYLARQVDLDRLVALKELGAFQASEPSVAERFVRESRVAGSLSHPSIVTVHDFFEYDHTPYIAMEYLSQGSLRPYVRDLSLPRLFGLLEGVLAGLAHAESRGVVHRDLKPENLMVTDDGRVKITDFGIAKATDRLQSATFQTAAGTAVGTPAYIAPEQALGEEVGPWTDLYSVGCIAYEAAAGRLPFGDTATPAALLLRHVNEPVVPPRILRPELEPSLSDWIERLLAKKPADRTGSATEAWDELEEIAIQALGARWRRDARLPTSAGAATAAPLRPASFGTPPDADSSVEGGEYTTHTPGGARSAPDEATDHLPAAGARPAGPATPPPFGAPGPELDITVGPDTPASVPAAGAARGGAAVGASGTADPRAAIRAPGELVEPPAARRAAGGTADPRTAIRGPDEPADPPAARRAPGGTADPRTAIRGPEPVADPRAAVRAPDAVGIGRRVPARAAIVAAVAVVVVVGVVAAVLLLRSDGKPPPGGTAARPSPAAPVVRQTVVAGPLAVELPAGWSSSAPSRALAALGLRGAAGATPAGDAPGAAVVGVAPAAAVGRSLLPVAVVRRLPGGRPPARARVRLGADGPPAYRYDSVGGGDAALTVYAVPTSAGVATVACDPPTGAPRPWPPCASVAGSLAVSGARVFPLGPVARYGGGVERAMRRLRGGLDAAAGALGSAPDAAAQARAAAGLSAAFEAAGQRLGGLVVSPADAADQRALTASVRRGARAAAALSTAAGREDAAAFAVARRGISGAARAADTTLRSLAAAGYGQALRTRLGRAALPALKTPPPPQTPVAPAPTPALTPAPTAASAPAPTAAPVPAPTPRPTPVPAKPTPIPNPPSP